MGLLESFKKDLSKGKWEVRRTIWPYNEGWGTVNTVTKTIMDTGLPTKEEAQARADALNAGA